MEESHRRRVEVWNVNGAIGVVDIPVVVVVCYWLRASFFSGTKKWTVLIGEV